jgi:hypothetical protein
MIKIDLFDRQLFAIGKDYLFVWKYSFYTKAYIAQASDQARKVIADYFYTKTVGNLHISWRK